MLGFLRRNLKVASTKIKLSYKAMVHPLIKYANTVWEPHCSKHISSIEDVQGRAARFVLNGHRSSSSVEDMLHQLKMKLPSLRTPMLNRPAHHVLQLKYPLDKHKCGAQTWNQRKGREAATACYTNVPCCYYWLQKQHILSPHSQRLERAPSRSSSLSPLTPSFQRSHHTHSNDPPPTPLSPITHTFKKKRSTSKQSPKDDSNGKHFDQSSLAEEEEECHDQSVCLCDENMTVSISYILWTNDSLKLK